VLPRPSALVAVSVPPIASAKAARDREPKPGAARIVGDARALCAAARMERACRNHTTGDGSALLPSQRAPDCLAAVPGGEIRKSALIVSVCCRVLRLALLASSPDASHEHLRRR